MAENPSAAPDPLALATQMVKSGRLEEAQAILIRHLATHPASEQAWLLMSYVVKDPAQQKDCLERVLRLNSGNLVARSKLAQINKSLAGSQPSPGGQPASTPAAVQPPETEQPAPQPPVMVEKPKIESKPMPLSPVRVEKPKIEKSDSAPPVRPPVQKPIPTPKEDLSKIAKPSSGSNRTDVLFRIAIIALIIIIVGIILTVLYLGVIHHKISGPVISPTEGPTEEIVFTLPPAWTPTNTPTATLTATITPTATPTATETPEPTATVTLRP